MINKKKQNKMIKNFKQFINEETAAAPGSAPQPHAAGEKWIASWVKPENHDETMGDRESITVTFAELLGPTSIGAKIESGVLDVNIDQNDGVISHPNYKWHLKLVRKIS